MCDELDAGKLGNEKMEWEWQWIHLLHLRAGLQVPAELDVYENECRLLKDEEPPIFNDLYFSTHE